MTAATEYSNAYVVVKEGAGWRSRVWVPLGFVYVAFSVGCSLAYTALLAEYTTNDYWWRQFNTTGGQTFIADLFNDMITLRQLGAFDLYDVARLSAYDDRVTFIDMPATAARRLVMTAIPLEKALATIRQNSLYENAYSIVAHCWVDFDRRFEMAHTAARQRRCASRRLDNAGVYLEVVLRNVDYDDLTLSSYGIQVHQTILAPIHAMPGGPAWVTSVYNHTLQWIPAEDEVSLWRRHGLRHFTLQFQNRFQYGLDSSITIVNAMMVTKTMTIATMPYIDRGLASWSTRTISVGLWSDMVKAIGFGANLVRNSNMSVEAVGRDWEIAYFGSTSTVGTTLMRQYIGPLANWDTTHVLPPQSLVELVVAFQARFLAAISRGDPSMAMVMNSLVPFDIEVAPPRWIGDNMAYYGGNPICAHATTGRSYVQMPFSFDDTCQSQTPFHISLDAPGVVFAMLLANITAPESIFDACSCATAAFTAACEQILATALAPLPAFQSTLDAQLLVAAMHDIEVVNISLMQMATVNVSKNVLLVQPIVGDTAWSLFGWATLFDWVDGTREVFTFEGDAGALTLMSDRSDDVHVAANTLELPKAACLYFWTAVVWVSVLAGAVMCLSFVYAAMDKFQIEGRNLFQFNRVVGSVWIGRPLLFVRGITAIIIVSTAPATIVHDRVTSFVRYHRPWTSQLLLYSESLWTVYVMNDIVLPITTHLQLAKEVAPLSSVLAFVGTMSLDILAPYEVQATTMLDCTYTSFRRGVSCSSGEIKLGSGERVAHILGLQLASLIVAQLVVFGYSWRYPSRRPPRTGTLNHVLIPAATEAYFVRSAGSSASSRHLDAVACVMSGMLPWQQNLFDFKIWATVERHNQHRRMSFLDAKFKHLTAAMTEPPKFGPMHSWLGGVGLLYMVTSISGSYAFLQLTQAAMANDIWWALFDTNTQVHLSNWFNQNLQLRSVASNVNLTALGHGALALTTNTSATALQVAPLYASSVQDEVNSLANVIQSLRQLETCSIPWVMTAYCYVDFSRRWEMAGTAAQQRRCARDLGNAAVYLESALRNTDWTEFGRCWGHAFDVGVFQHLQSSRDGLAWLSETQHAMATTSVPSEVAVWANANMSSYGTQWQNYKSLGVVETFSIQNAFGWQYPLTLKYSNGSMQLLVQTTLKMQRPLAHDLLAIMSNSSRVCGQSLVRSSSAFAYLNATVEDALVDARLLVPPLGVGFSLTRQFLGPFGSITMKRVACPLPLRELYQSITFALTELLASDQEAQHTMWPIYSSFTVSPRPKMWSSVGLGGGNVLCEFNPAETTTKIPGIAFSSAGSCGLNLQEFIIGDTKVLLEALIAAGNVSVPAVAQLEIRNPTSTLAVLHDSVDLLSTHLDRGTANTLHARAQTVKHVVRDDLRLAMVQFIRRGSNGPYSLSHMVLFNESDVDFDVYAWLYVFNWVQGVREVVSFEGDMGNLTLLSSATNLLDLAVNPMEVPSNVAYYIRYLVQYITLVMLCVAAVVCLCIVALRGRVEAVNMIVFSRLAGLVWIGRSFLFVRALSAICLLSTSTLVLKRPLDGLVSYFESTHQPWYMVVLAAGELNWMVYIINDVFSVVTKQYTASYARSSFFVTWIASAVWVFVAPPTLSVTLARNCTAAAIDLQVVCSSGIVEIGSVRHFYSLLALVVACCALCYAAERVWRARTKTAPPAPSQGSLLLYAAAKHHFRTDKWDYMGTQYIDKASAVLTGILSVEGHGALYIFDIKTWRVYVISIHDMNDQATEAPLHLRHALPLVE
ncbi:hypothetical protein DYB32_001621 [Aphanomyces invadans]|uniref:Uncharacterized protein n=1 Tax=Aphanomyces invadans TaxID=157072 RepID=A0A418B5P3_9STRA|nr:hypothetical protein DYB32_001621 [Aphanomyces invadans]